MIGRKTGFVLLATLLVAAACSVPALLQDAVEMPDESEGGEGLRWETDVATHPPSPRNVKAVVQGTTVEIAWERPMQVDVPHSYSDTIVHYRVFRRLAANADSTEIGTTDELAFVDLTPPSGQVFYHVTAVHEGDTESGRSDEAGVWFGSK